MACRRRYFYQYYARFDTELPLERIKRLRGLSSIPMKVGEAVHDVLAVLLQRLLLSTDPINRDRFVSHVHQTLDDALSGTELMEVHYGLRRHPRADELLGSVLDCLEHLLASKRYIWLVEVLQSDPRYLIEPPGYGETRLYGMKIYAKVDFLVEADEKVFIIDWKTGRQDSVKHLRQLLAYAAWAEAHLGVDAEQIHCLAVYLKNGYAEVEKQPTIADLQGFAIDVAAEINVMHGLIRDATLNIPLSKNLFQMTDNFGYCSNCQFRELCDRVERGNVS